LLSPEKRLELKENSRYLTIDPDRDPFGKDSIKFAKKYGNPDEQSLDYSSGIYSSDSEEANDPEN